MLHSRRRDAEHSWREGVFDYLDRTTAVQPAPDQPMPFSFRGGWVGYLGYELKAECGGKAPWPSSQPDACFIFADRFIAFDHENEEIWLVEQQTPDATGSDWLDSTAARLIRLPPPPPPQRIPTEQPIELRLRHGKAAYVDAIRMALQEIDAGESYEICLTNQITADVAVDGLSLHRILRHINPAPFAAFLRFDGLEIISASPERFMRVDEHGGVEAKPIKGTAPRGATAEQDARNAADLQNSEKDRAENLMIVDLLRNDIGAVCQIGSVAVPKLMAVESYATVHQLVTTVTGRLRPEYSAVRCVQRAFPGGSMTGAPKIRTLDILDRLEASPRGVYSGAIGYFGLGGSTDLSIVIRTIVAQDGRLNIGVGGAIVALSDPEAEFEEILLKAKSAIRAILLATAGSDEPGTYRLTEAPARRTIRQRQISEAQT
jgi:para-aminobenzoate synthetase